jgi:hypothetical protein
MLTGYRFEDPCIGRVYTNDFRMLTIEILVGCIAKGNSYITKIIAPTKESLVGDGDYVIVIQEVGDTRPGNPRKGVLFVSCEKIEPEIRVDWKSGSCYQEAAFLGRGDRLYAKAPKQLCYKDIVIQKLEVEEKECSPVGFKLMGGVPYFVVSPVEGTELKGALRVESINSWPLSWHGIPGWEDVYGKWLIEKRLPPRTTLRAW